jgi:methionyl-tRNA synthetase
VRLLSGTDDNSLKNVLAAEAAGQDVQAFVDTNAEAFAALREPLRLTYDDFIRTSTDPRHRTGVEALWRACAAAGDFYQADYAGPYCVGCESYLTQADLDGAGNCPEHHEPPQALAEHNWFFRLSRYQDRLHDAISSGRLRIEPESRRNEVLAFIAGGLRDFSVSRSRHRARGWGIAVPGDPDQVVYVWWDALGNYLTSLGFGGSTADYLRWWERSDRRVHIVGKGVVRFHAVYWPAMLLSAKLPLPTDIFVHDYLTVDGRKISKTATGTVTGPVDPVDPVALVDEFGADAVRWWLLREVPRVGDADFTVARLVNRSNEDLAGGVGNLVNRVVTMAHRFGFDAGVLAARTPAANVLAVDALAGACAEAPKLIDAALMDFDFRRAAGVILGTVAEANRCIEAVRPWERPAEAGAALGALLDACRLVGDLLEPFTPDLAERVTRQCTPSGGVLPPPRPLVARR